MFLDHLVFLCWFCSLFLIWLIWCFLEVLEKPRNPRWQIQEGHRLRTLHNSFVMWSHQLMLFQRNCCHSFNILDLARGVDHPWSQKANKKPDLKTINNQKWWYNQSQWKSRKTENDTSVYWYWFLLMAIDFIGYRNYLLILLGYYWVTSNSAANKLVFHGLNSWLTLGTIKVGKGLKIQKQNFR